MKYCKWRVWQSGDTDACGSPVVAGDYCAEHLPDRIRILEDRIAESNKIIERDQAELEVLRGQLELFDDGEALTRLNRLRKALGDLVPLLPVASNAVLEDKILKALEESRK